VLLLRPTVTAAQRKGGFGKSGQGRSDPVVIHQLVVDIIKRAAVAVAAGTRTTATRRHI
jgi:hypothetical protein